MNCMTWGQLKAAAEEAGILDSAPFLIDTGKDDGDLKDGRVGVYCPIEGIVVKDGVAADECRDFTGFFILEKAIKLKK